MCLYLSKILACNFLFWKYLCLVLVLGDGGFRECLGDYSFFNLLQKFKKDGYNLFMCLVEFTCETIWSGLLLVECFYYTFNFISSDQSVVDLFLLDSVLASCMSLESCPFLLGCQICWYIVVHSIILWFLVFLQYLLGFLHFHFLFCLFGFFLSSSW